MLSTLTTVAAFGPLLLWPGVVGDFMSYMPITVSMVLLASLLVALTVNPTLAATFMRLAPKDRTRSTDAEDEDGGATKTAAAGGFQRLRPAVGGRSPAATRAPRAGRCATGRW